MNFALDNQLKRAVTRQQRVTQRLNQQNPQPKSIVRKRAFSSWNIVWRSLSVRA